MLFLTWLPLVVSGVLLIGVRRAGELDGIPWLIAVAWYLLALYAQFWGRSPLVSAVGLVMQSALGVFLLIRLRTDG